MYAKRRACIQGVAHALWLSQSEGVPDWSLECSRPDTALRSTCNLLRQDAHGAKTGRSKRDTDSASGVHDVEAVTQLQQLHVCRDRQPRLHQPLCLLHQQRKVLQLELPGPCLSIMLLHASRPSTH